MYPPREQLLPPARRFWTDQPSLLRAGHGDWPIFHAPYISNRGRWLTASTFVSPEVGDKGGFYLYDLREQRVLRGWKTPPHRFVGRAAWRADGARLALGMVDPDCRSPRVRVLHVPSGDTIWASRLPISQMGQVGQQRRPRRSFDEALVCFAGPWLIAASCRKGVVARFDPDSAEPACVRDFARPLDALGCDPSGRYVGVAFQGGDASVQTLSAADLSTVKKQECEHRWGGLAVDARGEVISLSERGELHRKRRRWEYVQILGEVSDWKFQQNHVTARLATLGTGRFRVAFRQVEVEERGPVHIWDLPVGQRFVTPDVEAHCLSLSPDGRTLAVLEGRGGSLWDLPW